MATQIVDAGSTVEITTNGDLKGYHRSRLKYRSKTSYFMLLLDGNELMKLTESNRSLVTVPSSTSLADLSAKLVNILSSGSGEGSVDLSEIQGDISFLQTAITPITTQQLRSGSGLGNIVNVIKGNRVYSYIYDSANTRDDDDAYIIKNGSKNYVLSTGPNDSVSANSLFGIVGDGTTNDREGLRKALKVTSDNNLLLIIDKEIFVEIRDNVVTDPIEIYSNTNVHFQGNGKIIVTNDRIPLFWCYDKSNITFRNANMVYRGTHALNSIPAIASAFHVYTKTKPGGYPNVSWTGPSNYTAAFYMHGCENVTFENPKFTAESDNPASLFSLCIKIGDGSRSNSESSVPVKFAKNINITGATFDGFYMGILCSYTDGLSLINTKAIRYGILPLTGPETIEGSGWSSPPHVLYNTDYSVNMKIDNLHDEGIDLGGGNWGQNTLKLKNVDQSSITNITSFRDHGCFDFCGKNTIIDNIFWKGNMLKASAGVNGVLAMRWLAETDSVQENVHMSNIKLTDTSTTYQGRLMHLSNTSQYYLKKCSISNMSIDQQLWGLDASTPYFIPYFAESCDFDVNFNIRTPFAGTAFLWDSNSGAANNTFKGNLSGLSDATLTVKALPGSHAEFFDKLTAKTINLNARTRRESGKLICTVTIPTGGAFLVPDAIPSGSVITGVSSVISTNLGTTTGLTGFSIGTVSDADMFTTRSGGGILNANAVTNNTNWTISFVPFFAASTDIQLSPIGGTFDGTGVIVITIDYIRTVGASGVN